MANERSSLQMDLESFLSRVNLSMINYHDPNGDQFHFNAYIIALPVIAILGLVSNSFLCTVTVINAQRYMCMRPLKAYIIYLTITDNCFLFIETIVQGGHTLVAHGYHVLGGRLFMTPALAVNMKVISSILVTVRIWATILLTSDHYLAITHPMWHRFRRPKWFAYIGLSIISGIGVLVMVPRIFEYKLVTKYDASKGAYYDTIDFTDLGRRFEFQLCYKVIAVGMFTYGMPSVILIAITSKLVIAYRREISQQEHEKHTDKLRLRLFKSHNNRLSPPPSPTLAVSLVVASVGTTQYETTTITHHQCDRHIKQTQPRTYRILLGIAIKPLAAYTVPLILNIVQIGTNSVQNNSKSHVISHLLMALDASTILYIYLATSTTYRKAIRHMFTAMHCYIRRRSNTIETNDVQTMLMES